MAFSPIGVRFTPRVWSASDGAVTSRSPRRTGPDPASTPRFLELPTRLGCARTFFIAGRDDRRDRALARAVGRAGHENQRCTEEVHGNCCARTRTHADASGAPTNTVAGAAGVEPHWFSHRSGISSLRVAPPARSSALRRVPLTSGVRDWRREATPKRSRRRHQSVRRRRARSPDTTRTEVVSGVVALGARRAHAPGRRVASRGIEVGTVRSARNRRTRRLILLRSHGDLHVVKFKCDPRGSTCWPELAGRSRRPRGRARKTYGSSGRAADHPDEFSSARPRRDGDADVIHVESEHFSSPRPRSAPDRLVQDAQIRQPGGRPDRVDEWGVQINP